MTNGHNHTDGYKISDEVESNRNRESIENVSTSETLETSANGDAAEQPVPLSPGAYAVHTEPEPIFTAGEPARGNGLEEIAEDGKPMNWQSR